MHSRRNKKKCMVFEPRQGLSKLRISIKDLLIALVKLGATGSLNISAFLFGFICQKALLSILVEINSKKKMWCAS